MFKLKKQQLKSAVQGMLNNKLEILIEGFILSDASTELEHEADSEQYKEQHNTDQLLTPADTLPSKSRSTDVVTCSDQDRPLEPQANASTQLEHKTDSEQYKEQHNTDQLLTQADTLPSKSTDIVICSDQDKPLERQADSHYIQPVSS